MEQLPQRRGNGPHPQNEVVDDAWVARMLCSTTTAGHGVRLRTVGRIVDVRQTSRRGCR